MAGETVELSPFVVSSDKDSGYVAGNSLSGRRLNIPLKDTAASISVMTRDFLDDLGAYDLADALIFANNLQPNDTDEGSQNDVGQANSVMGNNRSYRVRGLPATVVRNYFKGSAPAETYNIERIDDSRGPNSVLFGIGSPGGIINVSTKRANPSRDFLDLLAGAGSFDSKRFALDANKTVAKGKLALRFNAVFDRTNTSGRHYEFSENQRSDLAVRFAPTTKTTIRLDYELGQVTANLGRPYRLYDGRYIVWTDAGRPLFGPTAPAASFAAYGTRLPNNGGSMRFLNDTGRLVQMAGQIRGVNGGLITDTRMADLSINTGGPSQKRSTDLGAFIATVEQRLGEKTFLEAAFNRAWSTFLSYDPQNSYNIYGDPNTTLPGSLGANPFAGRAFVESWWRQIWRDGSNEAVRLTLASEFDARQWGHFRVAVLGERTEEADKDRTSWEAWDGAPFNASPKAANNRVIRRNHVIERDWGSYKLDGPSTMGLLTNVTDPITGRTLSSRWVTQALNDVPRIVKSGSFGLSASWFGGRLIAGGGVRHDDVKIKQPGRKLNPITNEDELDYDNVELAKSSGLTRSTGVVAHVHKNISLLYNQSDNTGLPGIADRLLPDGTVPDPPEGRGRDYGVAVELLEGKLYARLVRFETDSENEVDTGVLGGALGPNNTNDRIVSALAGAGTITAAQAAALAIDMRGATYDSETEGYEFQLTASPGNRLRLSLNYSYNTGVYSNIASEVIAWWAERKRLFLTYPQDIPTSQFPTIAQEIASLDSEIANATVFEGVGITGNRKHKANAVARYQFDSGRLRGLSAGITYRYLGKMMTGQSEDSSKTPLISPAYDEYGLLLGYEFRLKKLKRPIRFQLNVRNLEGERDIIPVRYRLSGTGVGVDIVRAIYREPRNWRLSASYSF